MDDKDAIVAEFGEVGFGDKRRDTRFAETAYRLGRHAEGSILSATGKRSRARAFYRLLGSAKFSFEKLKTCVQKATVERISGEVLLIQDTSDANFDGHKKTEGLGYCSEHSLGIKIHSCLAVQPAGVTLGLLAQKYETRAERKDGRTKEERQRRPIEEKESDRWIETLRESIK